MHMNSAAFYLRVCSINMIWEKIRNRNSRDKRKQEMQRKPTETQALAHRGENRHKLEGIKHRTFLTVVRDFQGKIGSGGGRRRIVRNVSLNSEFHLSSVEVSRRLT